MEDQGKDPLQSLQRECVPTDTMSSEFWPLNLREYTSIVLSNPVCGSLLHNSQKKWIHPSFHNTSQSSACPLSHLTVPLNSEQVAHILFSIFTCIVLSFWTDAEISPGPSRPFSWSLSDIPRQDLSILWPKSKLQKANFFLNVSLFLQILRVLPLRDAKQKMVGLGILFWVLNAVGDLLRNYLGLCTPFIRKIHQEEMKLSIQSPTCPPPQAKQRPGTALPIKGQQALGWFQPALCKRAARAGWNLFTIQNSKKRKAIQSKKAVKGKNLWVLELVEPQPSDAAPPRREGHTEERMAPWAVERTIRKRPCTPAQSSAPDRGWTARRQRWRQPQRPALFPRMVCTTSLFHLLWAVSYDLEKGRSPRWPLLCFLPQWELKTHTIQECGHFLHPRSLGATCWDSETITWRHPLALSPSVEKRVLGFFFFWTF